MRFSRGRAGCTLAATVAAVVLAGPGAATAGTAGALDVGVSENFGQALPFAFTGVPSSIESGKYALTLDNSGNQAPHLIELIRLSAAGSALSDEELKEVADGTRSAEGVDEKGGGGVFAPPGAISKTAKGKFPAGNYAYFCFVGGPTGPHYRLGMFGRMTVTE